MWLDYLRPFIDPVRSVFRQSDHLRNNVHLPSFWRLPAVVLKVVLEVLIDSSID
jgi:hypothetical protein